MKTSGDQRRENAPTHSVVITRACACALRLGLPVGIARDSNMGWLTNRL
jgi:hypothetical protein